MNPNRPSIFPRQEALTGRMTTVDLLTEVNAAEEAAGLRTAVSAHHLIEQHEALRHLSLPLAGSARIH